MRWTGIADRTRAARLEHSLQRQDGGKETITNHREANAKGKPNIADTDAPNKLEPRIDSGTWQAGAWNCADSLPPFHIFGIMSKFQHASANVEASVSKARRNAREVSMSVSGARPSARSMCLERFKLLSHDERRMVEQHDSTRTRTDRSRTVGDIGD